MIVIVTNNCHEEDLQKLANTYQELYKTGRSRSDRVEILGYVYNEVVFRCDFPEQMIKDGRLDILKRCIEMIREKVPNGQVWEFELQYKDPPTLLC